MINHTRIVIAKVKYFVNSKFKRKRTT